MNVDWIGKIIYVLKFFSLLFCICKQQFFRFVRFYPAVLWCFKIRSYFESGLYGRWFNNLQFLSVYYSETIILKL